MKQNSNFFYAYRWCINTGVLTLLLLSLSILSLAAGPLKQIPLDNYVIQRVPVATNKGNTVIMFPSAIQALYASMRIAKAAKRRFFARLSGGTILVHASGA
jgi:hypothetical protein